MLKIGNISIDNEHRSVQKDGKDVHLTKLEYGLLAYMAEHADSICSRDDILDNVWGESFQYDPGTIDVHLNALRRKMGWNNKQPIETIRGIGFILHTNKQYSYRLQDVVMGWLQSHEEEILSHGLKVTIQLTPWVNELSIHPDQLRWWLDASLGTLLSTCQPGILKISSRLTIEHFTMTIEVNGTACELRIPVK